MKKKTAQLFLMATLLLITYTTIAQQDTETSEYQIGMQYYRNGQYNEATLIFKKLYFSNHSNTFYKYYLNCLINTKDYSQAEAIAKEQIKFDKFELSYWVDLGGIYSFQGNDSKANSTYQGVIKKLKAEQRQILNLANAFMAKQLFNYAEETYLEGKKLLNSTYGFQMEMAQLYYYMRNYDKMIDSYLDLLRISDLYLANVQNQLQNAVYNDVDKSLKEKLKSNLLMRLNQYPDILVYNELLVRLYIQDKDFENAFIQAKALDLRLNENGQRIMALAKVAFENNHFDIAINAYQYVINKGKHLEFYFDARSELLEVMYQRIVLNIDNQKADQFKLEESLIGALQDMGSNAGTVNLIKNLAHLQAFYLGKTAEAQFLLEDAITIRGINYQQKGELELELADIYLIDGKVWDATLAYARVEDNNKNNPIGSEAKFRKARLAYFIGDFVWAAAQLDVLKASTSKLIANDAANLSFFIFENSGWDTVETALATYAKADFLFYQSNDSLALLTLDTVITNFSSHELVDEAWLLKGKILQKKYQYSQSIEAYQVIVDKYYFDVLADNALFAIADLYENQLQNKEQAMELYKKIMTDFPDSIYKMESRTRFRKLRGDAVVN
ncbi:MAG: tetratricopeptide repeat protein [Salinivirgaceae bacterium]